MLQRPVESGQYPVQVVEPSALHLAIAAAFTPLQSQDFISIVTFTGETNIAIGFSTKAPVDLGRQVAGELSGIPVNPNSSGIEIDLSTLKSREQVRAVGSQLQAILIAAGSTISDPSESVNVRVKKFDQRDREFLDNVPPHHGG